MKENRRKQNTLLKLSAWVMLILMLSALLLIHIGAADENPIYTQNKALQGEKYGLLMQLKTKNIATAEGTNVNNYIHTDDEKLNSIDAETLSTTAAASPRAMVAHLPVNNSNENVPRFSGNGGFFARQCREPNSCLMDFA